MGNLIITISREFASGGRFIGEKLAAQLGIPFFDKTIIQMAAEKSGLSPEFIEQSEEKASNSFLFNLATTAQSSSNFMLQYDTPVTDKAFFAQAAVIRELAAKDSCVIVGRCADHVLREEEKLVKIFVFGTLEDRVRRAVDKYGVSAHGAEEKIKKIDKSRSNYYKYYTGEPWGAVKNFDLAINSTFTGLDGAVSIIKTMLLEKEWISKS